VTNVQTFQSDVQLLFFLCFSILVVKNFTVYEVCMLVQKGRIFICNTKIQYNEVC